MSNDHEPQPEITQQPQAAKTEASSDSAPRQYKAGELREVAFKDIEPLALIKHGSWGHSNQGTHASSLTLYNWGDPSYYQVEWDIPDLEETEHVGCYFMLGTSMLDPTKAPGMGLVMREYDGIMAMPDIVVTFLRELGFVIPEDCAS